MSGPNVSVAPGLDGYYAAPVAAAPGVVVLMEAYGLTAHIRRVCERLAAAGFAALAPDLHHGKQYPYDQTGEAIAAVARLSDDTVMSEIAASLHWLGRQPGLDT